MSPSISLSRRRAFMHVNAFLFCFCSWSSCWTWCIYINYMNSRVVLKKMSIFVLVSFQSSHCTLEFRCFSNIQFYILIERYDIKRFYSKSIRPTNPMSICSRLVDFDWRKCLNNDDTRKMGHFSTLIFLLVFPSFFFVALFCAILIKIHQHLFTAPHAFAYLDFYRSNFT